VLLHRTTCSGAVSTRLPNQQNTAYDFISQVRRFYLWLNFSARRSLWRLWPTSTVRSLQIFNKAACAWRSVQVAVASCCSVMPWMCARVSVMGRPGAIRESMSTYTAA
jgi:hypothetical protein